MQPPDITFDEARLKALAAYNILDTPPEAGFDDVVQLAANVCSAPVALVSLVGGDRQWFKARIGFEPSQTDLNSSVCAHALAEPDMLTIGDLTKDSRTQGNPLVTGDPHIRFYAGVPLRTSDGHVLGSLCVIDTVARPEGLTELQSRMLKALARQVITQLQMRRAVNERDEALMRQSASETLYRNLFHAIDDGFCIVEIKFEGEKAVDYRFVETNAAFARQTGLPDALGRWMRDLAPNHEQHWFDYFGKVALTGEPLRVENEATELSNRWYEVHAFRVGDANAHRVGILFSDISDRKAAEAQRKKLEDQQAVLNQEISHRMKNSFAMVQAIASQTLRTVAERPVIEAFKMRLHALAGAHDVLLQQSWSAADLETVIRSVIQTLATLDRIKISGPQVTVGARATLSLTLLFHELTTNALKYGSLSNNEGRVAVEWSVSRKDDEALLTLTWRETDGPAVIAPSHKGFGSKLVQMGLLGTGEASLDYSSSGFQAIFTAPLARMQIS